MLFIGVTSQIRQCIENFRFYSLTASIKSLGIASKQKQVNQKVIAKKKCLLLINHNYCFHRKRNIKKNQSNSNTNST